jgi:hypothetical protein
MEEAMINKVAESGIITLNLEDYYPVNEVAVFDLKQFLFMELILKEKDFREALKNFDVSPYENKTVALTCSADAVIPMWAYMLVASLLQPVAKDIIFGSEEKVINDLLSRNIASIDTESYKGKRVVVKGCRELPVSESAYISITKLLRPFVKSIMYGEPCSTVPVYKAPVSH